MRILLLKLLFYIVSMLFGISVFAQEDIRVGDVGRVEEDEVVNEIVWAALGTQWFLDGRIDDLPVCLELTVHGLHDVRGGFWQGLGCEDSRLSVASERDGVFLTGYWQEEEMLHLYEPRNDDQSVEWCIPFTMLRLPTSQQPVLISAMRNGVTLSLNWDGEIRRLFPYDVVLQVSYDDPMDTDEVVVEAIRLFQDGALVQELMIDDGSLWAASLFVEDFNFDGYWDIALPVKANRMGTSNALVIFPWLYNSDSGLFEYSEPLAELRDPQFNVQHRQVISYSHWHYEEEVKVYEWNDQQELVQVDEHVGYFLPLRSQGHLYYCWNMAIYDAALGELKIPYALKRGVNGIYELYGEIDDAMCRQDYVYHAPVMLELGYLDGNGLHFSDVLLPQQYQVMDGGDAREVQVRAGWCPLVPYYDLDTRLVGWSAVEC